MAARAILTPRANSHPFQERTVTLEQPLKIGRSVARSRPVSNNAIFDCKVLSRNHAQLYFEGGKFYLQDTKSSNGTFVNNVRLSKSSEESPPTQISSGDILQFGVDVMEVTKKVTHGCIVASLQLFTPDGKEAKAPQVNEKTPPMTLQDIYNLHQYLREAAEREEKLESKLAELKKLLSNTSNEVRSGWKILIEEDRLLARIDILERQLQACHKSMTEDKLREEVVQLNADKENYQEAAKEALRKSLTEKMEVIKKCQDLERTLSTNEEDHKLVTERSNRVTAELEELAAKFEDSERKCDGLTEKMNESSLKYKEELEALTEKLKVEQNNVLEKQCMLESLIALDKCTESPQGKSATSNHNEDLTEVASNYHEEPSYSYPPDSESNNQVSGTEINAELAELRDRVRVIESEKKDVITRLTCLLSLFEDLKGVANKTGVSDYLKEMIGKVDMELRQVKNFTLGHEDHLHNNYTIETVPQSNFLITQELSPEKNDELGNRDELSKDEAGLKKLLEESRESVHTLKKENRNLVAELHASSTQIQSMMKEWDRLTEASSKVEPLTEELSEFVTKNKELTHQLKTAKDEAEVVRNRVKNLEVEVIATRTTLTSQTEALEASTTENSFLRRTLDEKVQYLGQVEGELCEFKNPRTTKPRVDEALEADNAYLRRALDEQLQRVEELEEQLNGYKTPQNGLVGSPNQSSSTGGSDVSVLQVQDLEAELAVYKDRFASHTTGCSRLSQKEEGDGPFYMQRTFLIFIVVSLLLAILIAFSPR